ncbi:MAG: GNAT family N-acetyltransferase [Gemmatimonadaceae bacterium]
MNIRIASEDSTSIDEFASISIAFEVASVLNVSQASSDAVSIRLVERSLEHQYTKDSDQLRGYGPLDWADRFDISQWHFLVAFVGEKRVGGAALIMDLPDVEMLEGRRDLALLWDIRVTPAFRSSGVGSALLAAAETWATSRGAAELKVETQNINLPACRFYESHGFELRHVNAGIYEGLPNEVQLLWYKPLH